MNLFTFRYGHLTIPWLRHILFKTLVQTPAGGTSKQGETVNGMEAAQRERDREGGRRGGVPRMEAASAMGREKSLEISSYDSETLVGLGWGWGAGAFEAIREVVI
jgi:hypothetical protein